MCTVTFIPFRDSIFLTSNRDENPSRQARGLISSHTPGHQAIHYPVDEVSGGSWIALADNGRAVCLLNGAYKSFDPVPPYRLSRGQVVLSAVTAEHSLEFFNGFDLAGIAPFTLLVYEDHWLAQWIWDGERKYLESLPVDQPRIWSSVTLYPQEVRAWRNSLFEKWIGERDAYDREAIISFHLLANGDTDNDFVMNRQNRVKTLSITNIELREHSGSILHLDLDKQTREEIMIHYDR